MSEEMEVNKAFEIKFDELVKQYPCWMASFLSDHISEFWEKFRDDQARRNFKPSHDDPDKLVEDIKQFVAKSIQPSLSIADNPSQLCHGFIVSYENSCGNDGAKYFTIKSSSLKKHNVDIAKLRKSVADLFHGVKGS